MTDKRESKDLTHDGHKALKKQKRGAPVKF